MNGKQLKNSILQLAIQGKLVRPACRLAGKILMTSQLPTEETGIWYVYVIECEDGSFYKGFTTNLQKRYKEHCSGHGAEWTKKHKPKQLYYYEIQYSEEAALRREKYLKSGSGREWFKREVVDNPINWEPASELLKRIRKEKEALVKAKKIKKEKPLPEITDNEKPFEIPDNWVWCRIGEVIDLRDGTHDSPSYVANGYPLITSKDFAGDKFELAKTKYVSKEDYLSIIQRSKVDIDDILFSMIGGNIGNMILITTANYFDMAIKNVALYKKIGCGLIDMKYIFFFLSASTKRYQNIAAGGAQSFVSLKFLRNDCLPLPPLAEQKRIVAKIEELMPIINEYDKAQTELDKLNAELPERLKKSVLQEAIQGKLGTNNPADEPASELLKRIRKEKEALVKAKKIKKEKPLPEITDDEKPFEVPDNWEWCRLGEISTYNERKQKVNAKDANPNIWGLDLEDIEKGGRLLEKKTVGERKAIGDKTLFHKGDVLYSKLRPYLLKILVAEDDGICTPEIVPFSCYCNIDHHYMVIFLKSAYVDDYINTATFGIKMPRVGTETMMGLPIPLPPLAEQKRIVEKLDAILPQIENIK